MTAETAMRKYLLAVPAVAGLVGDRIGPIPLPQAPELPAITFQRISTPRQLRLAGPSGLAAARVQLDIWAQSHSQAREVFEAVRLNADGQSALVEGFEVQKFGVEGGPRDFYEHETKLHRVSTDLVIYHVEAA